MVRLKATVAYDGTRFSGFQVQPGKIRTVQGVIEKALDRLHKGQIISITASGRTDAGVHAHGQVFHFDSPLQIPGENWVRALNTLLPDDVLIKTVTEVAPDFHARYDVIGKEYRYRFLNRPELDIFRRFYTHHVKVHLDINAMKAAAQFMTGEQDFTSFCASNTSVRDKIRTVYKCELVPMDDEWVICVTGNGFLYQMVRIMTGTLLAVGRGKLQPDDVRGILEARDRRASPMTAPPHGLYLWQVKYRDNLM